MRSGGCDGGAPVTPSNHRSGGEMSRAGLRDHGVIAAQEFDSQKAKLLA